MPSDPRDYKVDIAGLSLSEAFASEGQSRPFIGVTFNCCRVYQRIYRSVDGQRYEGKCPRCARSVRFRVGPGGTDARAFVVE